MNIAITGVTGLVGRNLLFEIVKQHISDLENLTVFLLGRNAGKTSLTRRMQEAFKQEGFLYIANEDKKAKIIQFMAKNLHYVEISLSSETVFQNPSELENFKKTPIDFFFHLAALPDLRTSEAIEKRVMKANYEGTKYLLKVLKDCKIQEFDYVGTAFVSGKTTGNIRPDYLNPKQEFNNPYEKSKLLAEQEVRNFAKETGIRCRYFRPGIVCGRLIEQPLGHANKFDVFYQIFMFFYLEKLRQIQSLEKLKETEVDVNMRIVYDPNSGANIVAVDYLVKVLYQVCVQHLEGDYFHLVNEKNIVFQDFLESSQAAMHFKGVQRVTEIPTNMNEAETVYYSRGSELFTAYLAAEAKFFDTSNLQKMLSKTGLTCPELNHDNIVLLMEYATNKHFGLNIPKLLKRMGKA